MFKAWVLNFTVWSGSSSLNFQHSDKKKKSFMSVSWIEFWCRRKQSISILFFYFPLFSSPFYFYSDLFFSIPFYSILSSGVQESLTGSEPIIIRSSRLEADPHAPHALSEFMLCEFTASVIQYAHKYFLSHHLCLFQSAIFYGAES